MPLAIQTFDLTKTYGANRGIRNINLTIEQGEIFGFLGPNGAGKTSTMRMISAVSPVTSGTLRVLGLDPMVDGPTIKARMGAVHFLMKTLPRVSGEMALHVLAYNLTRVMNMVGSRMLIAAIRA